MPARHNRRSKPMTLLNKFGIGPGSGPARGVSRPVATGEDRPTDSRAEEWPSRPAVGGTTRAPESGAESTRVSNGLKELMWNLDGLGRGTLARPGRCLADHPQFLHRKGLSRHRRRPASLVEACSSTTRKRNFASREQDSDPSVDLSPAGRATRFFESNLQYPPSSFDVVLLVGFAGLSRSTDGDAHRCLHHRIASPRWRRLRDVPQQEARRIPALSRRGLQARCR